MAVKTEIIKRKNGKTDIYLSDTVTNKKRKVYNIDPKKSIIKFYPGKDRHGNEMFFLKEIILEGFNKLPFEFSQSGYVKGGVLYYLNKKLSNKCITKFIISKLQTSAFNKNEVILN